MAKDKGDGASGGGLKARIRAWEAMPGSSISPGLKHASGHDPGNRAYRKPGSQNKRKGGLGKTK